MDAFLLKKRKRAASPLDEKTGPPHLYTALQHQSLQIVQDEDSTEIKLACLASLHPDLNQEVLLDSLLASEGDIEIASTMLRNDKPASPPRKVTRGIGYQSSLRNMVTRTTSQDNNVPSVTLTKKGKTLFLYSPEDVEMHTPCSIIHNFLSIGEAESLLKELLDESRTFERETFQLFDRTVESPHSMAFFVDSLQELQAQKTDYVYNGSRIADIRQTPREMLHVSNKVATAVNLEIQRRIQDFYPGAQKLKFQGPEPWKPNTAFVNCYDGPQESVGYHSDQLTYLGPRAVIGSLSLGVAREFRVRRIVPQDPDTKAGSNTTADTQGQISIHLPHNSLLIMHAEMQESWKHAIAPATAIDPHPVAGNKRLNITYRYYKDSLHPKYTPKCDCGVPTVLRCCSKQTKNLGRYMWMCHTQYTPGQKGCSFFKWAEFDEDGNPPWTTKVE